MRSLIEDMSMSFVCARTRSRAHAITRARILNQCTYSLISTFGLFLILFVAYGCFADDSYQCSSSLLFPIVNREKWGAINSDGDVVIPLRYDWLYFNRFDTGLMLGEIDSFKIIISSTGEIIKDNIPYSYQVVIKCDSVEILTGEGELHDSFANNDLLESSSKSSSCDCQLGKPRAVQDNLYLLNSEFYCGVAFVISDDYWGYVNSKNEKIWTVEKLPNKEFFYMQQTKKSVQDIKFERILIDAFEVQHLIKDINNCKNMDFNFPHFDRREIRM